MSCSRLSHGLGIFRIAYGLVRKLECELQKCRPRARNAVEIRAAALELGRELRNAGASKMRYVSNSY